MDASASTTPLNENLIPVPQQVQPQPQKSSSPACTIFVWKFFSVGSWLLLMVTSLEGYIQKTLFFSFHKKVKLEGIYLPLSINLGLLEAFYLIILFCGFYNFAYLGLYKGDNMITDKLFDGPPAYHFIPLLLVSIINILLQEFKDAHELKDLEDELITDLVFTLVAFAFLLLVYFKNELKHEWFIVLTIKKGVFSMLIVLLWYNFFYQIVLIGYVKQDPGDLADFLKGSGIAGAILIGIGALAFSFFFKDLLAAITNLLIYIGMINSFFGPNGKDKAQKDASGGVADGVLEIIMLAFNLGVIFFLVVKSTDELF